LKATTNRTSPQIKEAAVVGLHSRSLGQKVTAIVVLNTDVVAKTGRNNKPWNVRDMRDALRKKLAEYKIPQVMEVLPNELPRNAMGKGKQFLLKTGGRPLTWHFAVNKKALVREVFDV
jgi:acyl-coenzyme A synthetase/AMP-(fatty) acid ligase